MATHAPLSSVGADAAGAIAGPPSRTPAMIDARRQFVNAGH